jgi:serine/threonine protein kinase
MGTVTDLALEYDNLLADGQEPDIRAFLARAPSPEEKTELLVELLASEAGYLPWDPPAFKARLGEFGDSSHPNLIPQVLRLVYEDRVIGRKGTSWSSFRCFSLDAKTLKLCFPGEGHYLGENLHGRYLLEERIGAGTFGVVFRASDLEKGHTVAVKTPHYPRVPALGLSMLCKEVEVAAKLNHPAIVPVTTSYTDDASTACLVMKYLDGGSLLPRMKSGVVEATQAVRFLLPVIEALAHAHKQRIFHRDVKPENILFDREGNSNISDFGFALSMDEQWNKEGEVAGTFAYMAPELLLGSTHEIDGRSDIWSVGMILFEMLTGSRFARESSLEDALASSLIHGASDRSLSFPENVPPGLRLVCERCLRRDPNERYQKAEDLAAAIAEATGEAQVKGEKAGPSLKEAKVAAWQMGTKLGLSFFHKRKFDTAIRSVEPQLPPGKAKLPPKLLTPVVEGAANQVASMNHYEECVNAALGLGIKLSPLPEEQRRCSTLIYQAPKLTSDHIRELPRIEKAYLEILASAASLIRTSSAASASEALPLFEMALVAIGPLDESSGPRFKHHAEKAGVPEAVWSSFLEPLLRNADEGTLRPAFNQLDKELQRYLIHHSET